MEDAVRPSEQTFKAMYERGYRTWFSLYETIFADMKKPDASWWECLFQLENGELNYPSFPDNLAVDASFSNTVLIVLRLEISDPQESGFLFTGCLGEADDHVTLLILAWTYILSARWAEIIPGASGPEYTTYQAAWDDKEMPFGVVPAGSTAAVIDLGDIDDDAARWWASVLALNGGWYASIRSDKGAILHSPWSTKIVSEQNFILSRGTKSGPLSAQYRAASFVTALGYISSYCDHHNVLEQSQAALAATLLLPVAKFDNRRVRLPTPRIRRKAPSRKERICKTPMWSTNVNQLNKLLALSCNAVGTKTLLSSVFFEPGVACNICGAWLQGTFAFLDSNVVQDSHILLRVLTNRDPSLGFLWLGAFIIGAHTQSLREARGGWCKVDLNAAAWTGTLMSFIQEPVVPLPLWRQEIPRADECRLMYLAHDQHYTIPPLFPFHPFGFTAIRDTNIDVRLHARCETNHVLEYEGLTWRFHDGQRAVFTVPKIPLRAKNGHPADDNIPVPYDSLDTEDDDCSEMVTRNIFTWLRDDDGFPVAERAIREHDWIHNLDSDDDSPITGDVQSTVGGNLHEWLSKTMTSRSYSL